MYQAGPTDKIMKSSGYGAVVLTWISTTDYEEEVILLQDWFVPNASR